MASSTDCITKDHNALSNLTSMKAARPLAQACVDNTKRTWDSHRLLLSLILFVVAFAFRGCSGNQDQPVETSRLPHYELRMAAQDLDALDLDPFSNATRPATFIAGGKTYAGVKVRVRGSWSRSWPKKSLKILFDHKQPFEERHSLNLNSG